MPELIWRIRWPDGHEAACYSPSTILARHFRPGEAIALSDFVARAQVALAAASDRVARVHGHPCSRAAAQAAQIVRTAQTQPPGMVVILGLE